MESKFCARCNIEIAPHWKFCDKCADPVERAESESDTRSEATMYALIGENPDARKICQKCRDVFVERATKCGGCGGELIEIDARLRGRASAAAIAKTELSESPNPSKSYVSRRIESYFSLRIEFLRQLLNIFTRGEKW